MTLKVHSLYHRRLFVWKGREMKLFKMGKKCKDKGFNLGYGRGKWLKNGVGQGFIFQAIISLHYTF